MALLKRTSAARSISPDFSRYFLMKASSSRSSPSILTGEVFATFASVSTCPKREISIP